MKNKELQKLSKQELIEMIIKYREKLDVNRECRELMRIDLTQGAIN